MKFPSTLGFTDIAEKRGDSGSFSVLDGFDPKTALTMAFKLFRSAYDVAPPAPPAGYCREVGRQIDDQSEANSGLSRSEPAGIAVPLIGQLNSFRKRGAENAGIILLKIPLIIIMG